MIDGWDRESARRIIEFTRAHERGDFGTNNPKVKRPRRMQITPMVCLSQPNLESIENGGTWPETITAKVVRDVDGYDHTAFIGNCAEQTGGDGGGGGLCRVKLPCAVGRCLDLHWGICTLNVNDDPGDSCGAPYGSVGEYEARLLWAGSYEDSGVEYWRWASSDGAWTATASPTTANPTGCGTLVVQWVGSSVQQWSLGYFPGRGGDLCQPRIELGDITGVGGTSSLWATWVDCSDPQSDSPYISTGTPADTDEPETPVDSNDGDTTGGTRQPERIEVYIGRFGNGVPLRGELFGAVNFGGKWYHVAARNSYLVGSLTEDETPRTIVTEGCGNRVPFVYTLGDPLVAAGSRHVIGWNAALRKYVAIAWECL